MKHRLLIVAAITVAIWLAVPTLANAATQTVAIDEKFQAYPSSTCPQYTDGDIFGPWKVVFTGYGCVRISDQGGEKFLEIQPKAPAPATNSAETHAGLVTSVASFEGNFTYEGTMSTTKQLRPQPAPNTWETTWVIWDYTDNDHFYYFIPKENGWELGKRDPAYPGGQRFLATGSQPVFTPGALKKFEVTKKDNTMSVSIDGTHLTTFTDTERPYLKGSVGVYTEDATIRINSLKLAVPKTTPDSQQPPASPQQPTTPTSPNTPASSIGLPTSTDGSGQQARTTNDGQLADTGSSLIDITLLAITLLSISGLIIASQRRAL